MTDTIVAPIVRGLALSVPGRKSAVVVSAPLTGKRADALPATLPEGTVRVTLPEADEDGLRKVLAEKLMPSLTQSSLLIEIRPASGMAYLLAVADSLDAARDLLASGSATHAVAAGVAATMADSFVATSQDGMNGTAAGRDRVVSGKIALVTGGAQGFGEEITRSLVASGAVVFIADINMKGAELLADELNRKEKRTAALALSMDVSNEQSVAQAFSEISSKSGGLDLVVSNAGILKAGSVLEQELATFDLVTRVNYTGFFLVVKHAATLMKRQRLGCPGHRSDIVQINSKSGLVGSNKNGAYAGSKFGGLGLVQSFALELVEYGIKVNAICPGNFFDGPLWSDPVNGLFVQYLRTGKVPGAKTIADVKAFYEAKVPMGRGCEGPDVMKALYYLIEQEYETGQALPVTGGQVMLN
jgi:sorbitol-6-phosphate 2-dehydrogenase